MKLRIVAVFGAAAMTLAAIPMFMMPDRDVPVERLIKIASDRLEKNPKDPENLYLLGRLHSLAFALENKVTNIYLPDKEGDLPDFEAYSTLQVERSRKEKLTPDEVKSLNASLDFYAKAAKESPSTQLYRFGLAWMIQEAAPFATSVTWNGIPQPKSREAFLKKSLAMYRDIYAKSKPGDLKKETRFNFKDEYLSREAGNLILVLAVKPGMGGLKPAEKADIQKTIKKVNSYGRMVTPIIFPVNGSSFDELINNENKVKFDLNGFADDSSWPWVTNRAGILVWDPRRTGKITSGRQLFGNATFWMFFENGYAALASLDNDQNGWLEGRELRGIAVWIDQNENAVSEPGEVKAVETHGISRINTMVGDTYGGMPVQLNGIHTKSGDMIPTYDWTPTSKN